MSTGRVRGTKSFAGLDGKKMRLQLAFLGGFFILLILAKGYEDGAGKNVSGNGLGPQAPC